MRLGHIGETITDKLKQAFDPVELEVRDESALHAGHAGARPQGETHFNVKIVSAAFAGRPLVQRHRMINEILAEELAGQVHALSIKATAPE